MARLFHIHIPKTGGTTLNHHFRKEPSFINGGHCFRDSGYVVRGKVKTVSKTWPSFAEAGMRDTDFKIAIIRNPFDWLVSYYGHRGSSWFGLSKHRGWQGAVDYGAFDNFDEFARSYCLGGEWHLPALQDDPLCQIKNMDGKYIVDAVLVNERLADGINWLCKNQLKCTPSVQPESLNVNRFRSDYRSYYTDELVEVVSSKFKEIIDLGGYTFDPAKRDQTEPSGIILL